MTARLAPALALLLASCDSLNLFTIEDDLALGQQLKAEIDANPRDYPPLDPAEYPEAYAHMRGLVDELLESGAIEHRDELAWQVVILHDDDVLNAFAAPGGYLWVYTGLIKALDTEDALAGVLGHEIGHADGRHSTEQLTQRFGIQLLLDIVLGTDRGVVTQVAESLVGLGFSRGHERDADERSVQILCDTRFAADGVAMFFEDLDGAGVPAFLSTHPNPANRVEDVRAYAESLGCSVALSDDGGDYAALLAALP